ALNQTWSGFNNQIGRDYSTLTVNLPKKDDGKIELSFVDATPQIDKLVRRNYLGAQVTYCS
ncbi:hypothetical protein IAF19_19800, partial [Acinetobacter baumannii]|nr:hypothetical protein [Acinetobacter baumannii]